MFSCFLQRRRLSGSNFGNVFAHFAMGADGVGVERSRSAGLSWGRALEGDREEWQASEAEEEAVMEIMEAVGFDFRYCFALFGITRPRRDFGII
jgi:hypothetical protein